MILQIIHLLGTMTIYARSESLTTGLYYDKHRYCNGEQST
jgi:hypothetical protein